MNTLIAEAQYRIDRDTAATSYLTRTGNADLLPMLGLVDEHADTNPGVCVSCGGPLRVDHRAATRYCLRVRCQTAKATEINQDATAGAR